jgi:hypothetical protein
MNTSHQNRSNNSAWRSFQTTPNGGAGAGAYQSEEWPAAWTYSDDKPEELVDKVIKKIRKAGDGKMVDTLRLADNRIYVGQHTVEGIRVC